MSKYQNPFKIFLGGIYCTLIGLFIFLSLPIYIYRYAVILFAKCFRPDLGDILSGQTTFIVSDYFADKPPRANIVVTNRFRNQFTYTELKEIIQRKWITAKDENGQPIYKKLQQFPCQWMGFTFWKTMENFCIDDYVHSLFESCSEVSQDMVEDEVEKMLNKKFPPNCSPWSFYLVRNFKDQSTPTGEEQCLIIFLIHHSLGDGFSITSALVEGLFENKSLKSMSIPVGKPPKRSFWESICHYSLLPIKLHYEMSKVFAYGLTQNHWKVSDERKHWKQVYTKSEPISIQAVKNIKNMFGVSFTSVILSTISAAICKTLDDEGVSEEAMICYTTLPLPGRNLSAIFVNEATGTMFGIPVGKFKDCKERLRKVNEMLEEAKNSAIPYIATFSISVFGGHLTSVCKHITKNNWIDIGLTNFPGIPMEIELNGKSLIDSGFVSGGLEGNAGVVIAVLSHDKQIRIEVSAEEAVMKKKQLKKFVGYITSELDQLDMAQQRIMGAGKGEKEE